MLNWQVGRVKITRIVEMDLPVPATVFPEATAAELRKCAWLYPHFVSEDDKTLKFGVHALLVEAPGLKLVVDTCIGNDRPREITGGLSLATPFCSILARRAGRAMESTPWCARTCTSTTSAGTRAGERQVGADLPEGALPHRSARVRLSGVPMMTRSNRRCSAIASSRSSTPASPSWWSWTT